MAVGAAVAAGLAVAVGDATAGAGATAGELLVVSGGGGGWLPVAPPFRRADEGVEVGLGEAVATEVATAGAGTGALVPGEEADARGAGEVALYGAGEGEMAAGLAGMVAGVGSGGGWLPVNPTSCSTQCKHKHQVRWPCFLHAWSGSLAQRKCRLPAQKACLHN